MSQQSEEMAMLLQRKKSCLARQTRDIAGRKLTALMALWIGRLKSSNIVKAGAPQYQKAHFLKLCSPCHCSHRYASVKTLNKISVLKGRKNKNKQKSPLKIFIVYMLHDNRPHKNIQQQLVSPYTVFSSGSSPKAPGAFKGLNSDSTCNTAVHETI